MKKVKEIESLVDWSELDQLQMVRLRFKDHVSTSDQEPEGPLHCEVFGRLIGETEDTFIIMAWGCSEGPDNNADIYTIVKHPGIEIKYLK